MFLFNAWYIAAELSELELRPLGRTILGKPLVIFKSENGTVAALDDRCPHRLVPLSLGIVRGENIRCAYHGAEFGTDGVCAAVPGQRTAPTQVRVRTYPLLLRHGYYWVWMGDPEKSSDESTIPGGYQVCDMPGWVGGGGHFESMKVDYRLLNDNIIDITHAEFVHPETFGGQEWA
jgi:vanillate O-demethylase monooxygenase subunit